mmetsp:Transcript_9990/g.28114  ORF Transcript_9990/g.28114 Transcript_9990/m.28114 type:complete len:211 (+) Transcript_9990:203-835(+)
MPASQRALEAAAQLSDVLTATIFSMPHAPSTPTMTVFPASKASKISFWIFASSSVGCPVWTKHGRFRSSLVPPSSSRRLTSPLPGSAFSSWYSVSFTKGTSTLWDEGHRSSHFLLVKMSSATMWALAWPCFPVFEVEISATLHGCPLIITWEPFLSSPACWGYTCEAPASAVSKVGSSCSSAIGRCLAPSRSAHKLVPRLRPPAGALEPK